MLEAQTGVSSSIRAKVSFGFRNLVRLYRYQLAGDAPLTAAALERAMKGRGRRRLVRKGPKAGPKDFHLPLAEAP